MIAYIRRMPDAPGLALPSLFRRTGPRANSSGVPHSPDHVCGMPDQVRGRTAHFPPPQKQYFTYGPSDLVCSCGRGSIHARAAPQSNPPEPRFNRWEMMRQREAHVRRPKFLRPLAPHSASQIFINRITACKIRHFTPRRRHKSSGMVRNAELEACERYLSTRPNGRSRLFFL